MKNLLTCISRIRQLYRMIDITQKKLLIFDCDGVLFDSREANIAYFNKCLEIGGYPPITGDSEKKLIYMSTKQLIDHIFTDERDVTKLYQISRDLDYSDFIPMLEPLFDFDEVLKILKKRYYLAIATNRGRSIIKLFKYFGFFDYFQFKISVAEAKAKPDPDMLIKCADYFDVSMKESVFIGDADTDMKAAVSAGMDFIWIGKEKGTPSINDVSELC